MKLALAATLAALALAGCGGNGAGESAADIVSGEAAAFVEVDSDLGSEQWQHLQDLVEMFPGRADLLTKIRSELSSEDLTWERDIDPALGETVAVVWLDFENDGENFVAVTKPDDEAKFRALMTKLDEGSNEQTVVREVDGWTFAAPNAALIARATGDDSTLAEQDRYADALGELPDDRLGTAYVDVTKARGLADDLAEDHGASFDLGTLAKVGSFAAGFAAAENGLNATFVGGFSEDAQDAGVGESYESRFLDEVPGDAFLFVSFRGSAYREQLERLPQEQREELRQFESMLGVSVDRLLTLFDGEAALYARPGALIPEVTLVLETDDEEEAVATVDRLVGRAVSLGGTPRTQQVEGVEVKTLQVGPIGISYGAFDGKLVVSLSTAAFEELRSDDEKLADAADFEEAAEAAGLPDETSGFFYLNVQDLLPSLEAILGFAGAETDVPSEVLDNVRPLRSIVGYAEEDGRVARAVLFGHIE